MNRLFARLLVIVFMALLAVASRAADVADSVDDSWLQSSTPCAQCS
ncbi:MAG: hypothetical protein H7Y89_12500 [Steroidobacteraceae bacterium]|nr:hypothetical protein [Steroidobacteraceae bacterium]